MDRTVRVARDSTVPHFARLVIEAGALAKPVVASGLGGPAELVKDGATGLLVPPVDADALAEAVLALIREPVRARAMGEAGYTHAGLSRHRGTAAPPGPVRTALVRRGVMRYSGRAARGTRSRFGSPGAVPREERLKDEVSLIVERRP
jgi:glycosyltransferase involved in cell wall biosynthesis